ncbi:MAG: CARDB domain-containing protein [Myxococcales bacterium]|nr:CARDB domain-containing protein [Myxococcales bacterium]
MRLRALVVSCLVAMGCTGESSLQPLSEQAAPVNQFRARSEALTLADGGQCPIVVNADAELMIRNLLVVEDPIRTNWSGSLTNPSDGAWTFGRLMTVMAGQNDPELFVRTWLAQWDTTQTVNGLPVPPRPMNALVTQPWLAASGGARLDLRRAPFRLLAIVNRMDLRDLTRGSAGEGRFVFGVLGAGGNQLQFTVILEFNLPATTQADVDRWAADWHALGAQPIGSPGYNQALETITSRFAGPAVSPTRPNGSAINQVRSNEIALSAPWELREFRLNAAGQLLQVPVAQTTDLPFNNSPALAQFINTNTAALLTDTHVVPATFNGAPFLAGSALTNFGHTWRAPGITNNEARFHFSVNTCNGCHAGETNTPFLHVFPRNVGQVAALSGFLTGTTVPDPVTGQPRTFNDLSVRSESLLAVLCGVQSPPTATVSVTAPTAGSTVRGPTTLTATGSGVTTVQFFIDGVPVSPPRPAPFTAPWSADFVPFGSHVVTAVGQTATGTVASPPVSFLTAPSSAPDFRVTISAAPTLARPGERFTAQLNVCNVGNQPGSTSVELFISADAVISAPPSANPDIILGGAPVSLNTGECRLVSVSGTASLPPGATSTSVFLGAIVDTFRSVAELDETNNTSPATPILIGVGPDFTISSVSAPAAVLPGATFTTTVTVCNRGNQPGGTAIDLLSSRDTTIAAPPDFFVGNAPRVTLSAGECRAVPVQTFALPPGTSFLGAIAVRGDFELVSTNNTSPARRIDVGSMADLTVNSVSAPGSALPGATFSTKATVCNNGTVAATTTGVVVLAASRTFVLPSPSAMPVGSFTVTIPASTCLSQALSGRATPPPGVTAAFLAVVLDQFNAVPEFIETNNQLASTTTMGIGFMPDFRVSSVSAPISVTPGSPFTANATVCNLGTVAGSTEVELRLSTIPMGMAPVTLNPNQCVSVAIPGFATFPPPGGGTLFSLTATADPRGMVPEFSETNNVSPAFTMAIGFGPDFVVTSVSVPTALAPGQPFTATVTTCNRGTAAGSTQVDLLISTDSVLSLAGDMRAPGGFFTLSAGQCQSQNVPSFMTVSAPPPAPGMLGTTFFIGGIADPNGSVLELNETNNISPARSFQLGFGPDFVITSFSAPSSAVPGALLAAQVTVCNRGTTTAGTDVTFIASSDTSFPAGHPIAPSDLLLPAQGNQFFSLAANACESRVFTIPALSPNGQTGMIFLAAVADFHQAQLEFSETNNTSPIRSLSLRASVDAGVPLP